MRTAREYNTAEKGVKVETPQGRNEDFSWGEEKERNEWKEGRKEHI